MMPYRNRVKLLHRLLLLTTLMIIVSGCIRDEDCYDPSKALLYISVEEGSNSTSDFYDKGNSSVDNAIVLIYDDDGQLQRIIRLFRKDIEKSTPIEIPIDAGKHPQVVVWGNLNGAEELTDISSGLALSSARISMQQENGYTVSTDNLYYGYKKLTDEKVQKVVISTWVGHVYITARGIENMPDKDESYYFTIESNCNSYDFYGQPQAGKVLLKIEAQAEILHQEVVLVHQPVNLIACPDISGEKQSMCVKLYKRTSAGDVMIASTDMNVEGDRIITRSGENTNVLLDLADKGKLNVYFILTPWEYIYQWSWW